MQMQAQQMQKPQQPIEDDYDFNQLEHEEFPDGKKLVKAFGLNFSFEIFQCSSSNH